MKQYEKPKLVALSLSGNDRLCGDCATKDVTIANDAGLLRIWGSFYGGTDATLTKDEFDNMNFFGTDESCDTPMPGFEAYCKFNSASATTIAWS